MEQFSYPLHHPLPFLWLIAVKITPPHLLFPVVLAVSDCSVTTENAKICDAPTYVPTGQFHSLTLAICSAHVDSLRDQGSMLGGKPTQVVDPLDLVPSPVCKMTQLNDKSMKLKYGNTTEG